MVLLTTQDVARGPATFKKARMHSSRICTVCCSGRLSCHTCPPPATHAPCHTHPLHVPLPCMPPCHAHPCYTCCPPSQHTHIPPCHTCPLLHHACPPSPCIPHFTMHAPPPPMDRILDMLVKALPFRNFVCER